jgi:hypothetical protein
VHECWLAECLERVIHLLDTCYILERDQKFPFSMQPNNDAVAVQLDSFRRVN